MNGLIVWLFEGKREVDGRFEEEKEEKRKFIFAMFFSLFFVFFSFCPSIQKDLFFFVEPIHLLFLLYCL